MDWNDPAARAALVAQLGMQAYNIAFEDHCRRSTVETVAGHPIRPVQTRFGRPVPSLRHTQGVPELRRGQGLRREEPGMKDAAKERAISALHAEGYTVLHETGSCGDGGHGTRLYYRRPDAPLNTFGWPVAGYATISFVAGQWLISRFRDA